MFKLILIELKPRASWQNKRKIVVKTSFLVVKSTIIIVFIDEMHQYRNIFILQKTSLI